MNKNSPAIVRLLESPSSPSYSTMPVTFRSFSKMKIFLKSYKALALLLVILLLFGAVSRALSNFGVARGYTYLDKNDSFVRRYLDFGIMIDAGSTGSRIHIYAFKKMEDGTLKLVDEVFKHTKTGLSSFAKNPKEGAKTIHKLLKIAKDVVPPTKWHKTPVALKATAGLRLLPGKASKQLLKESRVYEVFKDSPFKVSGPSSVSILDGLYEGIYAWITVNFLTGRFSNKDGALFGALDLGGGSTQITFHPVMEDPTEHYVQDPTEHYVQDPTEPYKTLCTGPYKTLQDPTGLYRTLQNPTIPYIQDPTGLYRTLQDPTEHYVQDPTEPYKTLCTGPYKTLQDPTGPYRTLQNPARPYVQDPTGPYRTLQDTMYRTLQNPARPYVQDPTGPYRTLCTGPYRTLQDLMYRTLQDPTGPYRTLQDTMYRTLQNPARPYVQDPTGPYRTLQDPTGPYRTLQDTMYRTLQNPARPYVQDPTRPYRTLQDTMHRTLQNPARPYVQDPTRPYRTLQNTMYRTLQNPARPYVQDPTGPYRTLQDTMYRTLQNPARPYVQDPTRPYRTLQDPTGPYRTLQDPTEPYRTLQNTMYRTLQNPTRPYVQDPTRPYRTLQDPTGHYAQDPTEPYNTLYTGPYRTLQDPTGPYRILCTGPYRTLQDLMYRTLQDPTGPYRTLQDPTGPYRTLQNTMYRTLQNPARPYVQDPTGPYRTLQNTVYRTLQNPTRPYISTISNSPKDFTHITEVFGHKFDLYTHSYLGLGLMLARAAIAKQGTISKDSHGKNISRSPCLAPDNIGKWKFGGRTVTVSGHPNHSYDACMKHVKALVKPVDRQDEMNERTFYTFSYFYDRAADLNLIDVKKGGVITVGDFVGKAQEVCSSSQIRPNKKLACMDATYITALLKYGYGFQNHRKLILQKKIDDVEVSWALGATLDMLNKGSKH
ncbi:hypothetical protein QZH41_018670 [Actinostola sp. cb2023]|nr:hypothetical protein QZH41_018670 [Actinostola sp. cb2023]